MPSQSVQSLLKKYGISPRKRLGQHFLAAMPTTEKIVAALELNPDDAVIEIGPGLGVMTSLVVGRSSFVFAVEKDARLLDIARTEFGHLKNVEWIEADILKTGISCLTPDALRPTPVMIVGNLPYNISSPILFWMLDQRTLIRRAVVMLQKEVAVRIAAKPGGKDYGILSVLIQAFADCKKLFDVSAKSFIPPPEVTSSVLRIDFREGDCGIEDEEWFRKVVKGAFGQRRKTIRNSLLGTRNLKLTTAKIDAALAACAIDSRRRPETLSVEEFKALSRGLSDD